MILWIDDLRQPPYGNYYWAKSVNEAKAAIAKVQFEYIDIDHDAGDYSSDGGDYIRLLDWMEENLIYLPVHIHSMNIVGCQNMRRIIERNHWKEIF